MLCFDYETRQYGNIVHVLILHLNLLLLFLNGSRKCYRSRPTSKSTAPRRRGWPTQILSPASAPAIATITFTTAPMIEFITAAMIAFTATKRARSDEPFAKRKAKTPRSQCLHQPPPSTTPGHSPFTTAHLPSTSQRPCVRPLYEIRHTIRCFVCPLHHNTNGIRF